MLRILVAFVATIVLVLTAPRTSEAAVYVVSSNADAGSGSLRAAIELANANPGLDTVSIPADVGTITLTAGEIVIFGSVSITADVGQVISGNHASRIFRTGPGTVVFLTGLTLRDGKTTANTDRYALDCAIHGPGGAVCAMGALSLDRCSVLDNTVTGAYSGGGGVFAAGDLSITNSLVSGNSAPSGVAEHGGGVAFMGPATVTNTIIQNNSAGGGGGMSGSAGALTITSSTISGNTALASNGGGLRLFGDATLTQTTVSGNSAPQGEGGGIWIRAISLAIRNSTITENLASGGGGGIDYLNADPSANSVTLVSTILADNQGPLGNFGRFLAPGAAPITLNAGNSLFGDPAAEIDGTNTANVFANLPGLTNLRDYGCATTAGAPGTATCVAVHAPGLASPALNQGSNGLALASDQRGTGYARTVGGGTDIGAAEAQGRILAVDPNPFDFGFVAVGSSASQDVTLSNPGTLALGVSAITSPAAPIARTGGTCAAPPFALAAGASCTLRYTFSPTAAGTQTTQTIQITSGTDGPSVTTLTLSGNTLEAMLVLSADSIDFGDTMVFGTSGQRLITISNPGSKTLEISSISGLGPPFQETFGGTCDTLGNFSVAPGGSCTLNFEFRPRVLGSASQVVTLASNAIAASNNVITLQGTGVPAQFVSPASLDFGDIPVGTTSVTMEVTLSNPLVDFDVLFTEVTAPVAPFSSVAGGTCPAAPFTLSKLGGLGQQSCTLRYQFSPTVAGGASLSLTGTFAWAPPEVGGPATWTLQGTGAVPLLTLLPDPLDFGNILVGTDSAGMSVTVANPGAAPLNVTAITAPAAPFAIAGGDCGPTPFTVAAAGSCTLSYRFSPTVSGSASQALTFTSDAAGTPDSTVALQGVGVEPLLALSPDPLDFGDVLVGTDSAGMSVTVANPGTAPLNVTAITAPAAPFVLVGGSCGTAPFTVAAAGSCTLSYRFSPAVSGSASQALTFTSDAAGTPDNTVTFQGVGVEPLLALSPDPLDFGNILVGTDSAGMSVTVSNSGAAPLNVTAITAPAAPFALVGGSCGAAPFTIAAAGSCTLSYRFSPTVSGSASQVLTFTSDAAGTPDNTLTLQGVGVAAAAYGSPKAIPSLTGWGILLVSVLLGLAAVLAMQGRGWR